MNEGEKVALTRSFKELVQQRVANDPAFGEALLREGIDTMLAGDVDTGKAALHDWRPACSCCSNPRSRAGSDTWANGVTER